MKNTGEKENEKDVVDTNEHIVFGVSIILTCTKTIVKSFFPFVRIKRQLNCRFTSAYVGGLSFPVHFHARI